VIKDETFQRKSPLLCCYFVDKKGCGKRPLENNLALSIFSNRGEIPDILGGSERVSMARRRVRNQGKASRRGPAELGAAPHGESKIIEMPIRTDHYLETRKRNIAQTPNMRVDSLAPSVGSAESRASTVGRTIVGRKIAAGKKKASSAAGIGTAEKSQRNKIETMTKKNTRNTA